MGAERTERWVCAICGYVHEGPEPPEECPVCGAPPSAFDPEEPVPAVVEEEEPVVRWVCTVCGYVHEGPEPPEVCEQCGASSDMFEREETTPLEIEEEPDASLEEYLSEWSKSTDDFESKYARVRDLSISGTSKVSPMRTQRSFPAWESVLFKGAQLFRMPLNEDEAVSTKTEIGKTAQHPLELDIPFYVSHMSFGALSKEAKVALARGSRLMGSAICSGEGGLLPEERTEARTYIYELGTAPFSHRDDFIRQADAVEIKIGQAAKPGLGGHLPKEKVTEEIAKVRGIALGEDSISPGRYSGIQTPEDLKAEVSRIRQVLEGRPLGIKITAGHVEEDLEVILGVEPDFITIDCRGGGTGSAPIYVKDNVCVPPIFALHRARKYLDRTGSQVSLCITGGFRDSADIAKALAMGADAVALATASLIAIGCQQYRICNTGKCPVGITTQDPELRARFDIEKSVKRFVNFYSATKREVECFARINGRNDIHELDLSDLVTISNEISQNTEIEHV